MMEITNFKLKNHLTVITPTGCYVNIVLPAQWSHVSRGELEGNNTSSTIPSRLSASLCAQCSKINFENVILCLLKILSLKVCANPIYGNQDFLPIKSQWKKMETKQQNGSKQTKIYEDVFQFNLGEKDLKSINKVSLGQEACAKCFAVHLSKFEILQITWKNKTKPSK